MMADSKLNQDINTFTSRNIGVLSNSEFCLIGSRMNKEKYKGVVHGKHC